jgi:hypothetical protein
MYQAATGHERRAAHRALAAALGLTTDGSSDGASDTAAGRRAWHLAAAAYGPDPEVAADLDRVGERAERAGGFAAAAAAYARAGDLTEDEPLRARRFFAAARCAWAGGQTARAASLAQAAKVLADDRLLRADIDRLRARVEINVGSAAMAHHIFVSAARAVAGDDPVRALEMRVAAALTNQYDSGVPDDDVSQGSAGWPSDDRLPDDARTRCLRALLATTTADSAHRWADARQHLGRAVDGAAAVDDPDVVANVGNAALHLGDDDGHRRCFTRMLAGARERGAVTSVLYALPRLAFADLTGGTGTGWGTPPTRPSPWRRQPARGRSRRPESPG